MSTAEGRKLVNFCVRLGAVQHNRRDRWQIRSQIASQAVAVVRP